MTKHLAVAAGVVNTALLSACIAYAEPNKFPDIGSYTPVNAADYRIDTTSPGHPSTGTYFLTPEGIACNFPTKAAQCTGNDFPAIPPAATRVNWVNTMTGLKQTGDAIGSGGVALGQQIKTLPPFHSITVGGVICGVDDRKTTACKDPQGRGFVLSPTWSGWLPKI